MLGNRRSTSLVLDWLTHYFMWHQCVAVGTFPKHLEIWQSRHSLSYYIVFLLVAQKEQQPCLPKKLSIHHWLSFRQSLTSRSLK